MSTEATTAGRKETTAAATGRTDTTTAATGRRGTTTAATDRTDTTSAATDHPDPTTAKTDEPPPRLLILREIFDGRRLKLTGILTLALLSTAATLVLPWTVGKLLQAIQDDSGLAKWTWLMVAVGVGSGAANALATYSLSRMGHQLVCRLRIRSMRHAIGLKLHTARREGTGNLASRLTADASAIKGVVDIGPTQLPMAVVTLLGTMVIMGWLDWILLLITLGAFLAALGVVAVVFTALRRKYLSIQNEVGALTEHFVATMEALTVIKAHRAERAVSGRLGAAAERVARYEIGASGLEALLVPVINLGQQVALVAVILGGGARMTNGDLDLSTFVSFLLYLFQLTAPLIMAISSMSTIQMGLASRKRFDDLFALPSEFLPSESLPSEKPSSGTATPEGTANAPASRKPLPTVEGAPAVRFEKVDFAYGTEPVLREVDLTVPATGLTAMVGLSGSGKSTVLGLVERFMDPGEGRIEVFGHSVDRWPLSELRGRLAYVDQGSTLLRDTVRHNLTLGQEKPADDATLLRALRNVGLAGEIDRLPDGLDTVLGGAHDLSGGQRQRLALARASLSDAPLVLLDEPSSQLDSLNEKRLRALVDEISRDRAVLVVAHRISTVQHADHVIVMDGGRVTAQGRHDDLMRTSPMYAELVRGQELGNSETTPPALAGDHR
ncbi:ABC transporter ATP-binding protein [Streptomyces huiliensis]|uniref:ABC transporter ATP-binding protein n=1 Tax=Streptomyces huiliensis TaxID=2876027 RepID=UPI001CBACB92|nr:ABC transporter ATP-binding protein [Streptomyces huiliensis]MBZ4320394.1 ABC transporter ATP-binding protein/permease [Streptomyces huiliensis]